jgi:acetylornithine aminotransferase
MEHILKCHDFIKNDIIRAENCYLYDRNNRKYVDFESGIWCTVAGHNNPKINRRMIEQINQVIHLGSGYTNFLAEDAAKRLLKTISEEKGKCVFLSSGSEAVEFGINVAKLITGKGALLTLSESYLGAYGSSSTTSSDWVKINLDKCLNCKEVACLKSCANLGKIDFADVCAFVFEPGCSSGKVIFPPEKLVELLQREVKSSGGLIVADEVTTGMGRTGKWYGFHHYGMDPDIIALGKGLGNGYPVSAVTMKREIAKELEKKGFRYVQSHQNDPLGCAIASEVIKVIGEENLVNRSFQLGDRLFKRLNELKNSYSSVKEVRGRGLMAVVEFEEAIADFDVKRLSNQMLQRGFIIGFKQNANLIRFMPPLTIEEKEIENMVGNLDAVLTENMR